MLYPMFAMVLLTFIIGLLTVRERFRSVSSRSAKVKAFVLMDGPFPERVVVTTRCFNNQFELPVLFYVGALAYLVLGLGDNVLALSLAWIFVFLRVVHAIVHLTYNHLLHRVLVFWLGFIVLILMWAHLLSSSMGL